MRNDIKISGLCIIFLFCLHTTGLNAQILKDTSSVKLVKSGIDHIYNFQFKEAREICNKIGQSFPGHPVGYLLNGMIKYWENYPLLPSSPSHTGFEEDMHNCIKICEKRKDPSNEAEFLLTDLCARGMLLLYYSDNNLNLEIAPLLLGTYQCIRRSFDFTSVCPDFFYFTGIYNYYRQVYPEVHPVYKPFLVLIPKGDKGKGIKELQKTAKKSIFLQAESLICLSDVFLRFENNYTQAISYNKTLYELYPSNLQYKEEYIKNLLLLKQYDKAEELIHADSLAYESSLF